MSVISYAGVVLPYANTSSFGQDAVYDDVGGVDRCYTKFDISAQFLINASYLQLLAQDLVGGGASTSNPAFLMKVLRSRLLQPRQSLSIKVNGEELIPSVQTVNGSELTGVLDAKNGPMPQYCRVLTLNSTTFLVMYRIIAHYWENPTIATSDPEDEESGLGMTNSQSSNVLFNRWGETASIDDCGYTTRTRSGKFVIRSDNAKGKLADELRSQMAVLSIPNGFLRQSSHYTISPDGLGIEYQIVDKEVFKKPPDPNQLFGEGSPASLTGAVFKADGDYVESTTKFGQGAMRFGEVSVRLQGSKTTDQAALVKAAILIGNKRLQGRAAEIAADSQGGPPRANSYGVLIEGASLKVSMYTNDVEYRARAMFRPTVDRVQGMAAFAGMSPNTPGSPANSSYTPPYLDRGTASLLLRAASYYDPNLVNTVLGPPNNFGSQATTDNPPTATDRSKVQMPGTEIGKAGIGIV